MKKPSPLWKLAQALVRILTSVLFDLKVYGLRNVPRKGGVLLVTNHESYLDPALIGAQLYRPISYLAKSELFKNRFFGSLITNLNAYPVRQGAGDVGAIKETIRRLHEGHILNIFPEGTRTENGELGQIEPGVSLVVRRAGVPIIPVVITGSFEAWPRKYLLPHPYPTRVLYGKPMDVTGLKGEQITVLIDKTFREMLVELRSGRGAIRGKENAKAR